MTTTPTGATGSPTAAPTPVGDTVLEVSHATLDVSIIGCAVKTNDRVLVNSQPADGVHWTLGRVRPETGVSPARVDLNLAPGYYDFTLTIGSCVFGPFPLIASDIYGLRHLTLFTDTARMMGASSVNSGRVQTSAGLVGTIPDADLQVSLEDPRARRWYQARIEQGEDGDNPQHMYYFDQVVPGKYTLRMSNWGWTRVLGAVDLSAPGKVTFCPIDLAATHISRLCSHPGAYVTTAGDRILPR